MKFKVLLLICYVLLLSHCSVPSWVAPENPNPSKILSEARADVKNRKYDEALLKYIWINEHSLEFKFSFWGVRSSYAIDEWHKLGIKFPKAQEKYNDFRNKAKQAVMKNDNLLLNFSDFQSFNGYLGKPQETIDLFLWLDKNKPHLSGLVYPYVKRDLFNARRFDTLNKYIDPQKEYEQFKQLYTAALNYGDNSDESMFIYEVYYMVTILKENNRIPEAQEIISKASKLIKDPMFKLSMNSILED